MIERIPGPPGSGEFSLRVWVPMDKVRDDSSKPVEGTTTYRAFKWHTDPGGTESFYDYIFSFPEEQTRDGMVGFNFAKSKTEAEKNTAVKTWKTFGNHYWPPVLKSVKFFQDRSFPVSTNGTDGGVVLAARLYARIEYIPPASEGTLFLHEVFTSPTPFSIGPSPVPMPTAVSWDYHSSSGSFPECLHGKLVFPAMRTAYASYSSGGGAASANGAAGGQVFPATNFETWQPYTSMEAQEQAHGAWVRTRVTVFPPAEPETITR